MVTKRYGDSWLIHGVIWLLKTLVSVAYRHVRTCTCCIASLTNVTGLALLLVRHIGFERAPAQCAFELSAAHLHTAHELFNSEYFLVFSRKFSVCNVDLKQGNVCKTSNLSLSNIIWVIRENSAERNTILTWQRAIFIPQKGVHMPTS